MKKATAVFIGLFLLVIVLPLLFIDRKSEVAQKENRNLAAFPRLLTEDGRIDCGHISQFPRLVDGYINDRFGGRSTLIKLAHTVYQTSKKVEGKNVIGKDGWRFYSTPDDGNNIIDFFKMNLLSESELAQWAESIAARRKWCDEHNIKFLFLIAPNKHNVYPEYYPFERPDGITRTEQIIAALPQDLKDTVVYPLDELLQHKGGENPLYYETDTHWNMAGAYRAYKILFDRMTRFFPETHFPQIDFITETSFGYSGDKIPHFGYTIHGKITMPLIRPVDGWEEYYHYTKHEGRYGMDGVVTENTDASLPKAIIFRDSFFSALEPFVSTLFSSVDYHWRLFSEEDKQIILQNKPDIIIWEVVERLMTRIPHSAWNTQE